MVGKRRGEAAPTPGGVEEDVVADTAGRRAIRRVIAAATTSRGARSASGCTPAMTRAPAPSSSTRALAADRLGDQRPLPAAAGPVHSTVGWNCTNSRSASGGAGAQRQRQPVAGRDGRVGGRRRRAGRSRRWRARPRRRAAGRPARPGRRAPRQPATAPRARAVRSAQRVERRRAPVSTAARGRARRRPASARPPRRWRRRRRGRSGCAECPPSRVSARTPAGVGVERARRGCISRGHRGRALGQDRARRRPRRTAPRRPTRVSRDVRVERVAGVAPTTRRRRPGPSGCCRRPAAPLVTTSDRAARPRSRRARR